MNTGLSKQPQVKSKNFVGQYDYDGLLLNVFGTYDEDGNFCLEAIGMAGTMVDISNLISDEMDEKIIKWAEFMAPLWKQESKQEAAIDYHTWSREMAVAF